ncbi:MAG: hypothetical protein L0H23_05810 [Luteimonas sp.]|nr:hypothetical protein [Luteimonas sp.]
MPFEAPSSGLSGPTLPLSTSALGWRGLGAAAFFAIVAAFHVSVAPERRIVAAFCASVEPGRLGVAAFYVSVAPESLIAAAFFAIGATFWVIVAA